MKPILFLSEHGATSPLRITSRTPLAGVFLSVAWCFDGDRLQLVNLAPSKVHGLGVAISRYIGGA